MSISAALVHRTEYNYDRLVKMSPQVIRLRPAPHTRTPVTAYTLRISPEPHFLNWQQDPQGNWQARVVFPEPVDHFHVEVEVIARLDVFSPFDFFIEENAEHVPFKYDSVLHSELEPYLRRKKCTKGFRDYKSAIKLKGQRTIDFLVEINQKLQQDIDYRIRMEPGVQTPDETLKKGSGSCRDSAWLLVQLLRHHGIAARFVSGYLIQLKADVEALDGPSGTDHDFTDLHAWCEAYVPGAGWIGLDPTSGLLAGEGHIPLSATPEPSSAAPISGAVDECEVTFAHHMEVSRLAESPRVTLPYSEEQWTAIDTLGQQVDADIQALDMRLTMGGEPTFVSIDDMQGEEWNTAAVGPAKQRLSAELARRIHKEFAPGGLISFGQGKWYPGESLPRWAYSIIWRSDGEPIWSDTERLALYSEDVAPEVEDARALMEAITDALEIDPECIRPAYEDPLHCMAEEGQLPPHIEVTDADIDDPERRARLSRIFSQPLSAPRGFVLPIQHWQSDSRGKHWLSEVWEFRRGKLFLIPGDSSIGLRLPLEAVGVSRKDEVEPLIVDDPTRPRPPLPARFQADPAIPSNEHAQSTPSSDGGKADPGNICTAMAIEPGDGMLSVFMPPVRRAEEYLELIAVIEGCAKSLDLPIRIEGYPPPDDPRLQQIKITPDPGVVEVNIHPASNWDDLRDNTTRLYEVARLSRLGTEKFMVDGKHCGTGGGNHIVVGAATPLDSPFLRRPDMLASVIRYWQRHPSLSYLFGGQFIGPTSQSPRVDEARDDLLYELDIALNEIPMPGQTAASPWLVDRVFRNLLTDLTGNTHRAEICIDKLYSPDSATGRLGLVEFRAFEMPPHAKMSLAQQLLVRALLVWFWREPYARPLRRWGPALHDEMLLPQFLRDDINDVVNDLNQAGFEFDPAWFAPHYEFRFPRYGEVRINNTTLEVRGALEPWPTMGEEPGGGGTARYVDSSLERVQLCARGLDPSRYAVLCNGRRLPLQPTGVSGEYVAGVRFRAWQPWSCLHPTVKAHNPLVFDLVDLWSQRSIGGCTYHVHHPGGRSFDTFPVNSHEAESRRLARFFAFGHTPGPVDIPDAENNPRHRVTLDLRRQATGVF